MTGDERDDGGAYRLTTFSHGAGCACKLSPAELSEVMSRLTIRPTDRSADLLVGTDTSDDAAVMRLRDDLALVFTTDFFTPIVDDAFDWGRVAATNALSDVYAMGGTPLMALNLVAWPRERLPLELLSRVLEGGASVAADAGCLVVGGHSIDDAEPKYGMAVIGTVHPDRVLTNAGAQPGDVLVLTKPIGIGAITTGAKHEKAPAPVVEAALATMTTLNRGAMDAAVAVGIGPASGVHAATDVTGFGLLGHAAELAAASGVSLSIRARDVPVLDGARELLAAGMVSGGTKRNLDWVSPRVDWSGQDLEDQYLLADAQTSGGLLISCTADAADHLVRELRDRACLASSLIGDVHAANPGRIHVV